MFNSVGLLEIGIYKGKCSGVSGTWIRQSRECDRVRLEVYNPLVNVMVPSVLSFLTE